MIIYHLMVFFMINEMGKSTEVLERLMSSYGVKTQKELALALGIPANNISGWTQRDSVPGNSIIKCALDTGADLQWLVSGELAKASFNDSQPHGRGKALYEEIMSNGGRPVLRRIMDAYGFTLQKQLCELLDISSGTVSTWVRRDYFPGDVVVACALDTGVPLLWLATGKGMNVESNDKTIAASMIPRKNLTAGVLQDAASWSIDLSFIPHEIIEPLYVFSNVGSWIVDNGVTEISNGRWLLGIDGKYDVYDIALLPRRKISVFNKATTFTCGAEEVSAAGKVILTMDYNF